MKYVVEHFPLPFWNYTILCAGMLGWSFYGVGSPLSFSFSPATQHAIRISEQLNICFILLTFSTFLLNKFLCESTNYELKTLHHFCFQIYEVKDVRLLVTLESI
jgi:hypothetical protein